MSRRSLAVAVVAAACSLPVLIAASLPAEAQRYRRMSCSELWYERNEIYAQYGYCFKTPRAIREFGRGCFPPYGRLPRHAREQVDEIVYWERRKGCDD
jgi:hypothetical protein